MIDMQHFDDWLATRDYSPETVDKYRRYALLLGRWLHDHELTLEELRPGQMLTWLVETGWGPSARHNALYGIRSYLRGTGRSDHPLLGMRIQRPDPGPQRTPSIGDVRAMLQACAGDRPKNVRNRSLISLLVDTGLRASEVCRLRLDATDLNQLRLSVLGKARKLRACVFSPATAESIRAWLPVRARIVAADTATLFCSVGGLTPGRALTRYGCTALWRDVAARAGLAAGLSSHDFRRTFAVESLRARMPLLPLRIQGGWARLDMLEIYLKAMSLEDARSFLPAAQLAA